ncbi:glycoside hydrolase family 79 protein [Mycena vulgaris]|nr:glycoside hydrolase family 79 protein [Mycena vulgaris]
MFPTLLRAGVLCWLVLVRASITVYSQMPFEGTSATGTATPALYTGSAAYDPTVLIPPPIPYPPPPTNFSQQLSSPPPLGLSIPQSGYFYGFSIEFSVINQICGQLTNALFPNSHYQVPFLNLMSLMAARGRSVRVRIGGNTQETATMVSNLPDGKMMESGHPAGDPSQMLTPPLLYTPEVVYMLANISSLINVQWYLGILLNDTQQLRLEIAEVAEAVLGDARIASVERKLIGSSISGNWELEDIWATGFLDTYKDSLAALAVEYYPENNCATVLHTSNTTADPQEIFYTYLNHTAGKKIMRKYLNSTMIAQSYNKPFVMFESNTASCDGFPGALDYGLQMASSNLTGALLHVGGRNVYYNLNSAPAPPTNQSTYHSWTIGPIYYSALIVSHHHSPFDRQMNNDSIYTPGYAIYDTDVFRLALSNYTKMYISDPTGASDYIATFSVDGAGTGLINGSPAEVKVKYLRAPSVSNKQNITWAGQTFGSNFASDGRLTGVLDVQTISCDTLTNTCRIQVPAPGFALMFLDELAGETIENPSATTWPTTAQTRTINTLSVDPSMLATSDGHWGANERLGRTSPGRKW